MKIIDIIKQSAEFLGLGQELEVLNNITEDTEETTLQSNEELSRLLNLSQYAIQELCTNYIPVTVEEEIQTENKRYALNKLNNYIKIVEITKDGNFVDYKIVGRNITFAEDGKYFIKFATYPKISSLFDEIDFLQTFSPDVLVMGLCSFYALTKGMFEEYDIFRRTYCEKAEGLKQLKVFEMPMRRWG
ncbi:MAG: hypothetical protein IKM43_02920 [Clostridia bacterium]|nr:hypothetical protein [Clostridia bacterium]